MQVRTHLIKPELGMEYPQVSHGEGVYLFTDDGQRYLDGCSGAVTVSIGHNVKEIIQAMQKQAEQVSFVYRTQFTSKPAEELAKELCAIAPGDINWVFFVNSGSEATETAMKIAIQYWQEQGFGQKTKVLSRWMSYHGITLGALSMSGHVLRRKRFISLLEAYPSVSAPYCYRCPYNSTPEHCGLCCAEELETAIQRHGAENIAAFIAEPVIGASGGAVTPPEGYYQKIQEICQRHNILFIADEVMTGLGRTGRIFGVNHWGVEPDIITLGKGMSAGYTPIAATLVSDRIIQVIKQGSGMVMSGHTYSANPLSAAISLAVLNYIREHELTTQAEKQGLYLRQRLEELKNKSLFIGDVRGLGLLLGLEIVADKESKQPFPLEKGITARLIKKAFSKGLLIYSAMGGIDGHAGDAVLIAPPLTITKEELDELIHLLTESIMELEAELQAEGMRQP